MILRFHTCSFRPHALTLQGNCPHFECYFQADKTNKFFIHDFQEPEQMINIFPQWFSIIGLNPAWFTKDLKSVMFDLRNVKDFVFISLVEN